MINKKGLSEFISNMLMVLTLLMVLLTIVAVTILWSPLQPLLMGSGGKISLAQACLSANLEVTQCSSTTGTTLVKRNLGQEQVNISKIKLIYGRADGSSQVIENATTLPAELGSVNYANQMSPAGSMPATVAVAAGINDAQGTTNYCNPTQPVSCR